MAVCSDDGEWSRAADIKCVDASRLGGGWLAGPARVSINIIYCLLALLILMSLPLLVFYCCARTRRSKGAGQGAGQGAEQEGEKAAPSPVSPSSPQAGVYSVSSGCVLQPATVIYLHISTSQYLHISTISTYPYYR